MAQLRRLEALQRGVVDAEEVVWVAMEPISAHDPEPDDDTIRTGPVYSAAGVDLGLIRWFLSLTPAQRLETLQNFVDFAVEARNARETGEVR